jgi:hypothetical protein
VLHRQPVGAREKWQDATEEGGALVFGQCRERAGRRVHREQGIDVDGDLLRELLLLQRFERGVGVVERGVPRLRSLLREPLVRLAKDLDGILR